MDITKELTDLLHSEGCTLFGFADITVLPEDARKKNPVGIILAHPMFPGEVVTNAAGFTLREGVHGGNTFEPLDRYTQAVVEFLKTRKYKANTETYKKSVVTDKTVGTLGGLGWIGCNGLLTTPQVGPALRLSVVLTNAPLVCAEPYTASLCPPDCFVCRDICPAQAINGKRWARDIHRDAFLDVHKCMKGRKKQPDGLCWLCIGACPLALKELA